ncbi:hypothetical protein J1N35_000828 [Gossypium stocksii]|uniref:Uncharacterized protein n=1 Tax=Gossypium stocksii TaxID=47602 RepID=A0A9D4AJ15_9ROSI|nr:hypothetical protein J1N35_000828 [Gossypium stocksii]
MIYLDDYDFMLGLNFIDNINALVIPFVDYMCILDARQQQCVVLVSQDMRGETKVLSAIQLAKDVSCDENIDLVDQNVAMTPFEMLEG